MFLFVSYRMFVILMAFVFVTNLLGKHFPAHSIFRDLRHVLVCGVGVGAAAAGCNKPHN